MNETCERILPSGKPCGKRIGVGDFFIGFKAFCKEHEPGR